MRYLLYFFYITWYWGVDLAIFIIRHEIKGEKNIWYPNYWSEQPAGYRARY